MLPSREPRLRLPPGFEGALAEFSALREEIQERTRTQHQLLSLQLTVTATIFGFVISQHSSVAMLLIVPFTSYLLCGRLVSQHFGTLHAAEYIVSELSPRVPGGLNWEDWLRRRRRKPHLFGSMMPLLLTFVGAGVLALVWTARYVFVCSDMGAMARIGMAVLWVLGLALAGLSTLLLLQMSGRSPFPYWRREP